MLTQETTSPTADEWLLWQLADSAFPTGAFAHSAGLEAARQSGFIPSAADLENFILQALQQTVSSQLPFLAAAHDAPEKYPDLDRWLDATLSNHVANRASRAQGRALLASAEKIIPHPTIAAYRRALATENLPGHFPIAFAVLAAATAISRDKTVRLFLFMTMRTILSAAVRLGIAGPIEAQHLQFRLRANLESFSTQPIPPPHRAAQTAPLLELLQATQDRLYSRLFQS